MYEFALCDDDAAFVSSFSSQLADACSKKNIRYVLSVYSDIPSFLETMNNGIIPDLIFMDIFVMDKNGMDFAREMRANAIKTDIVFISCSPDYALDGYEVKSLQYLLKPIQAEKLQNALTNFLEIHTPKKLALQRPGGVMTLDISDIPYMEIFGHEILIYTFNGTVIPYSGTLKEMEHMLSPYSFIRSHRSYLVNLSHVTEIKSHKVRLSNGKLLPVSRPRYKEFQNQFIKYMNTP